MKMQKVILRNRLGGVKPYWNLVLACGHIAREYKPDGRYTERKKCKQCLNTNEPTKG